MRNKISITELFMDKKTYEELNTVLPLVLMLRFNKLNGKRWQ